MIKIKFLLIIPIITIYILFINSCIIPTDDGDDMEPYLITIVVDLDGTEIYRGPGSEAGLLSMNNNEYYILYSENLSIRNLITGEFERYLTDINIDYEKWYYLGIDTIGLSYDDKYVAFTSGHELYCLDLDTGDYENLTSDYYDEFPKFGIDDTIYFSRKEGDNYKLMSITKEGNNLTEICILENIITHIYPSHIDGNTVYFVLDQIYFYKLNVSNCEIDLLTELPVKMGVINRSNDDRYFSFSRSSRSDYIYDTQTDSVSSYLPGNMDDNKISKIIPNKKRALTKTCDGNLKLMIWDIKSDSPVGEEIVIENTGDFGLHSFCITPDGEKAVIIHKGKLGK